MKKLLLAFAAILLTSPVYAQTNFYSGTNSVAIGTSSPTAGTALDLGSNTNAMLMPVGTTGQRPSGVNGMVRYNSTSNAMEAYVNNNWTPLTTGTGPNGMVLLATVNASSASSVSFGSTYLTSAYNKYQIEYDSLVASANGIGLHLQVSTNNCSSTISTTSYSWSAIGNILGVGGVTTGNSSDSSIDLLGGSALSSASDTNANMQGTIRFSSPATASHYVNFDFMGTGYAHGNSVAAITYVNGGAFYNSGSVNCISIYPSAGTITGNFHLYGLLGN